MSAVHESPERAPDPRAGGLDPYAPPPADSGQGGLTDAGGLGLDGDGWPPANGGSRGNGSTGDPPWLAQEPGGTDPPWLATQPVTTDPPWLAAQRDPAAEPRRPANGAPGSPTLPPAGPPAFRDPWPPAAQEPPRGRVLFPDGPATGATPPGGRAGMPPPSGRSGPPAPWTSPPAPTVAAQPYRLVPPSPPGGGDPLGRGPDSGGRSPDPLGRDGPPGLESRPPRTGRRPLISAPVRPSSHLQGPPDPVTLPPGILPPVRPWGPPPPGVWQQQPSGPVAFQAPATGWPAQPPAGRRWTEPVSPGDGGGDARRLELSWPGLDFKRGPGPGAGTGPDPAFPGSGPPPGAPPRAPAPRLSPGAVPRPPAATPPPAATSGFGPGAAGLGPPASGFAPPAAAGPAGAPPATAPGVAPAGPPALSPGPPGPVPWPTRGPTRRLPPAPGDPRSQGPDPPSGPGTVRPTPPAPTPHSAAHPSEGLPGPAGPLSDAQQLGSPFPPAPFPPAPDPADQPDAGTVQPPAAAWGGWTLERRAGATHDDRPALPPLAQSAQLPPPVTFGPPGEEPPPRVVPSRAARHASSWRAPRPQVPPRRTATSAATAPPAAPRRAAGRAPGEALGRRQGAGAAARPSRLVRARPRVSRRALWQELPFLAMIAVILAVMVKAFVVQAYYIPSRSMVPTLEIGDRVLVNRTAYKFGTPQHGQVAVFVRPDPDAAPPAGGVAGALQRMMAKAFGNAPPGTEDLIKRVIGTPGDVVAGRGGKLYRNGQPVDEPYLKPGTVTSTFGPVRIEPGQLWMMGDNREDSADSRTFGPIKESDLVGRAVVLIWPFDSAGGL